MLKWKCWICVNASSVSNYLACMSKINCIIQVFFYRCALADGFDFELVECSTDLVLPYSLQSVRTPSAVGLKCLEFTENFGDLFF